MWMDARRREGSKFPEIDVFGDVYVRPGMSWPSPFIQRWWEEPVGSSGVRLPASSRDSDRVCGSSTGCWISDLDETLDQTLGRSRGHIVEGWGMPGGGNLDLVHRRSQTVR
ncbi:hypothetical protein Prudu_021426 [Prunus dulcis]|uniref:Uncharacterized protein n=1 Tax=Prunus dulcis TaxID=3755 RepID=A0A4Y1RXB4_PRUDU|nr:hypothetical protein Prudu_021426 [Prunus dulcis]